MDKKSRQTVFFGVIAICTLIIAMIGATLAFFSVTAKGTENEVYATSDVVSIDYTEGTTVKASNLIPSDVKFVKKAYNGSNGHGVCKDDKDKEICSAYYFTVSNNGSSAKALTGKINVVTNEFTNLKYLVYKQGSPSDELILDSTALTASAGGEVSLFGLDNESKYKTISVPTGGLTQDYVVVIYLEEAQTANDVEQGKSFIGSVSLSVTGGTGDNVTGYIEE